MKNRRFEVQQLDKGFEINVWEEPESGSAGEVMYTPPMRGVAASEAEVRGYFSKWIENKEAFKF